MKTININLILWFLMIFPYFGYTQQSSKYMISFPIQENESWWCGIINHGEKMPIQNGYCANMNYNYGNQVQPLMLSNQGRFIWSEYPYKIEMENDSIKIITCDTSLVCNVAGRTLDEGFRYLSSKYFPPNGELPDCMLFTAPQFNTWIELIYNQNQEDIVDYARQIIKNGFSPGVLMIDDNWQENFGKWDFHPGRFQNPKAMVDTLHQMGFKIMLWICPFISPDCDVFRMLHDRQFLLKDSLGNVAIVKWWNGYSALLDLSNNTAEQWFREQLENLQKKYYIDGFKFDAGDFDQYYNCFSEKGLTPNEHCEAYARIGLDYPLNEFRAMWKMAGKPLVNRLRDKKHDWSDLQKLIPHILVQGLMGYNFTCPDLIGGGSYASFLPGKIIDQELIVRSAQCHALMPMMQFSVAPWRVLDEQNLNACKKTVELRKQLTPVIMKLAEESSITGEPIVRSMEYVFPHQGYDRVIDQFFLGDSILIAPIVVKGRFNRMVILPKGKWEDENGRLYKGDKIVEIDVPLERLPYFRKIN